MKTPPLLLPATLLFWGWQTEFLIPAMVMAVVLEAARWLRPRWEFSDQDFSRIWTFCTLVFLASAVYAFTSNEGPSDLRLLFQSPGTFAQHSSGAATARTAAALFRWLPMIFFLFVAAQTYSSREGIPPEIISLILRRRWRKARKAGLPLPAARTVDISYPYFALCLCASSVHASEGTSFFWGTCALLAWALWPQRPRRFGLAPWAATLAVAFGLAYLGQSGMGRLQNYLGNMNAQWLSSYSRHRFDPTRSQTQIGRIGRLKASGQIVIRLHARTNAVPGLLREASYRAYKNSAWYAELLDSDWVTVRETNREVYQLIAGKSDSNAVNIACYLEGGRGLLPLPEGSSRLEHLLAFDDPQKSSLGAVLVQGPGLVVFDALFGPGASLDSPADETLDLAVPQKEEPALQQVASELGLEQQTPVEAVRTVQRFFLEKFSYRTWQPPGPWSRTNETAITRFLLRTRSGHCEYFATAGVLLLRSIGIPARYAVGYAVHEGSGGSFVVRQRDAHAWCLVWDKPAGVWRDLDLTPGSWLPIEAGRTPRLQPLSDAWSWFTFQMARLRWGQTHLRQYLFWTVIPILALLFSQIMFRRRRRHVRRSGATGPSMDRLGLDSEFYQLERKLAERGLRRQSNEALSEWLARALGDPQLGGVQESLQHLLMLHYRYRFDPQGLTSPERQTLRRETQECLKQMD